MKLFLYYAFCSFKNQIKKIFRSWVAILLVACILLGVIFGVGAALLADYFDKDADSGPQEGEPVEEEVVDEGPTFTEEQIVSIIGLIASGAILAMLLFNVIRADKDGSDIFLMADVNLLFAAPMRPQSVLLFRLMSQIFVIFFASIYLLAQLPNLIYNVGMGVLPALSIFLAWAFFLIYGKLLNVFVFTVTSTKTSLKRYIRPFCYGVVLLIGGAFLLSYRTGTRSLFDAADAFFNGKTSLWIPVYGWIKGLIFWTWEENWLNLAITLAFLVGGIVGLSYAVWNIKADFYEDAMAKSQVKAERLAAAQAGTTTKRNKDRSEKIRRDGLNRGSGAAMFFWKSFYNRFRFAFLRVFTKTADTYLIIALFASAIMIFGFQARIFPVAGFAICLFVFFRSLGNPLARDVGMPYFITVPENPWKKVFFSLLGGSFDCLMDVLPAMVISGILLRASVWQVLSMILLAVSVDFYAENVMLFIELSVPTSMALQIKQVISILFIYFGLIPVLAVGILVGIFLGLNFAAVFASLASLAVGAVFFGFSPLFLQYGRK